MQQFLPDYLFNSKYAVKVNILRKQVRLFLILLIPLINSCGANELDIVSDKKAMAEIVMPMAPSSLERKSALVLQDYIRRITGVTLDILSGPSNTKKHVFFVGNSLHADEKKKASALSNEGFEIIVRGDHIYLTGGAGKGLLYGVYELIEKQFGARKYDQGPALIYRRANLTLPKDLFLRYAPPLRYRESYYPPSTDGEYLDWHHLHRFEDLWGLWGHSFFKIIPPERYFKAHPEYFSLTNGKRQASQLCLTNPEVQKIAIAYFRAAIADNPDAQYWSIAPMDGRGHCTCDRCAKVDAEEGGPQGSLIRFVNAVAAHFPEQLFTTLAYGYTAEAPKRSKPRENVYVMLSTIDVTRQQGIATNPTAAAFRRQLKQWSQLSPNIFVWDYTTQFTAYLSPFPMYDQYRDNIAYMYRNGVKGIFEHGSGATLGDMSAFASYMQAKSLWDPMMDQDQVAADFLNGYYGEAAEFVKDYMQLLIKARQSSNTILDIYGNPISARQGYLNEQHINRYRKTLAAAREKAVSQPLFLTRVNTLALGLEYAALEQAKSYGVHPLGFLQQLAEGKLGVAPHWAARVDRFLENALKAGGRELAEVNGSLEEYRNQWLRIMSRPYKTSLLLGQIPTFRPVYLADYPANGDHTLSDGLLGDTDYSYNWLLFNGGNVEIIFPLQQEQIASRVQLNFLLDPAHYLFLPNKIQVEGSEDGRVYTSVGMQQLSDYVPVERGAMVHPISVEIQQRKIRYLRIAISFSDELPDWFDGGRHRKPLVAIDEIRLE